MDIFPGVYFALPDTTARAAAGWLSKDKED